MLRLCLCAGETPCCARLAQEERGGSGGEETGQRREETYEETAGQCEKTCINISAIILIIYPFFASRS